MIYHREGDLLSSEAECLVNGVNCEGVMGKGIAFQFKQKFPSNYLGYVEACRTGECSIGRVYFHEEKEKLIANFPSKNRWRQPSLLSYIKAGLVSLVNGLIERGIRTVAVPPLGCGNGGLNWADVRSIIIESFDSTGIDVYLYEPSVQNRENGAYAIMLNVDHLVLLHLAFGLQKNSLDMIRLEAAAFMMNVYRGKEYFQFDDEMLTSKQISSLSRDIRIFKDNHGADTTKAAAILYSRIVSDKVNRILKSLEVPISKSSEFVNSIEDNTRLKAVALIVNIVRKNGKIPYDTLVSTFINDYNSLTGTSLSTSDTEKIISDLIGRGLLEAGLFEISLPFFQ